MSIFSNVIRQNNLQAYQIDEFANTALNILQNEYTQFSMTYDESGVIINNFEKCSPEETGGWTQEQVEANLTDELLQKINRLAEN